MVFEQLRKPLPDHASGAQNSNSIFLSHDVNSASLINRRL